MLENYTHFRDAASARGSRESGREPRPSVYKANAEQFHLRNQTISLVH